MRFTSTSYDLMGSEFLSLFSEKHHHHTAELSTSLEFREPPELWQETTNNQRGVKLLPYDLDDQSMGVELFFKD